MLFMFFPFRNESDLKATVSGIYMEKLLEPSVTETVNKTGGLVSLLQMPWMKHL